MVFDIIGGDGRYDELARLLAADGHTVRRGPGAARVLILAGGLPVEPDGEALRILNAGATAEAAVELILRERRETLCGARAAIFGFGRIGKLLAPRLLGLGARVTVVTGSPENAAWCRALGYDMRDARRPEAALTAADIVINTAPAPVLGAERLGLLRPGALIIDLASLPSGVDRAAAESLGLRALHALALPGKSAPVSAGEYMREALYEALEGRRDG